jgi:uncharacterized protein
MKFTLDARTGINLIRGYRPGEVLVGERALRTNCIVTADTLIAEWNVADPTQLDVTHLEPIFALQPELVLLGTGSTQRFPSASVRSAFIARRIGLETMDLGAACRTYNILVQEERKVAAALFLE